MESHEKNVNGAGIEPKAPRTDSVETNGNAGKRKLKDLDDLFPYVGDVAWYQQILFFLMIPYAFLFALIAETNIF